MKVIEYNYKNPKYNKPTVTIEDGIWIWKTTETFVCLKVGFCYVEWVSADSGRSVSGDEKIYNLLNDTGVRMQLEAKEI